MAAGENNTPDWLMFWVQPSVHAADGETRYPTGARTASGVPGVRIPWFS